MRNKSEYILIKNNYICNDIFKEECVCVVLISAKNVYLSAKNVSVRDRTKAKAEKKIFDAVFMQNTERK